MGRFIDLAGQKFGRLTVIKRAENKGKKICWLCKCECGNTAVVRGDHLKNNSIKSCGCYNSEKAREKMSKMVKEKWQDETYRQMRSEQAKQQMKEQWQDEDFRKMRSEKMKQLNEEQWQDEDFRKMRSEKAKEQWQNEEMKWKMHYKGGITPISMYLRKSNSQWFEDCKQKANYTCQLTGKCGNVHTHHLKAFSTIVLEAHNLHNIEIKPLVKDYTDEELKLLEEYVESWHKDNSNAVVLSENVHMLFHSLYGKGNNTPEQFEEFKERYLAEEFKEILN